MSIAQNYRDEIAPLPHFFSEASMAAPRDENDVFGGPEDISNLIDERQENGGQRRWYRINPLTSHPSKLGKSSSSTSVPADNKPRRVSLARFVGTSSEMGSAPNAQQWRLADNEERRRVSIDRSSLSRDLTGSLRGDMAFV